MKTHGQTVASNLAACQIISSRDVERVAKQIDESDLTLCTIGSLTVNGEEYVPKRLLDEADGYIRALWRNNQLPSPMPAALLDRLVRRGSPVLASLVAEGASTEELILKAGTIMAGAAANAKHFRPLPTSTTPGRDDLPMHIPGRHNA